jgi:hypothetical protein
LILLLKKNKLSDDLEAWLMIPKFMGYGYAIASAGILIGRGISHIYYDILNPEKSLMIMEERLRDEKYWEDYKNNPEAMKKDKEIIEKDIEKFKKMIAEKAEKKRKKEEKETQKKQVGEGNATNHSSSENKGAFPFFLTKKISPTQNCDTLFSHKFWRRYYHPI